MNVMTDRQKALLTVLAWQKDFITVQQLAKMVHKSIRTIYGDLTLIENWLLEAFSEVQLEKKRSIGIRLTGEVEKLRNSPVLREGEELEEEISPENRQQQIATDLLIRDACVTYQGLMDKYFVSSTSIKNDLQKIRRHYKTQLYSGKKGTGVEDNEEHIRESIFILVEQVLSQNGIQQVDAFEERGAKILSQLFGKRLTNFAMGKVFEIYYGEEFTLPDQYLISLTVHLLTYLHRLMNNHTLEIESAFLFQQINSIETYYLAHSIVEDGKKHFSLNFNKSDVEELNHLLISQGVKIKTTDYLQNQQICASVGQLIGNMSEIFEVNLSKDMYLREHLVFHFIPMIYRLKSGIKIVNPLLDEIKEQYTLTFNSVWYALGELEEKLGLTFNDDEVSFIAVYFQVALEKMDFGKKILIVCPTGIGTSELIVNKIRKILPQKDILEVTTLKQLEKNDLSKVDFIISSVEISEKAVPVVQVTPLVNQNDLKKIHVLYSELFLEDEVFREETEEIAFSEEILQVENFYTKKELKTKEEILNYLIDKLEIAGDITPEFRKDIFQREKLGTTSLESGVAIPHASPIHVTHTRIMVLTLQEGIYWDQNKVEVVILICIAEADRKRIRGILSEIYKVVATSGKVVNFKKQVEEKRKLYDAN